MKEFIEFVAKHLVDYPEQVTVGSEVKEDLFIFKLKVAEGDVGKIIGKSGKTATAFRVLLRAVASKERKRVVLDIVG